MAKKKEETEQKNKLQEVLEKLDKQYGKGSVMSFDAKNIDTYNVISSGSIAFDYITLGIGGFCRGKLYELMSWEGAGKTTLCGHVTAECQKSGGKVLYVDGEFALDRDYFKNGLGVDTSKLLISQPTSGEEGFQIALDIINSGEIDLVILDSDSSLMPLSVVEGDVGESSIGKKARLNSSVYPKIKVALAKNNVCMIVCSQYREKIGVMFGPSTTTQGGHSLKYFSDARIELSKSLAKDGDINYGNITKVKCIKNKMASPYRNCSFEIVFGKGIDKLKEIIELGSEYEIIKKWGKTITMNDVKYEENEFREHLLVNEFFEDLKSQIIEKIKQTDIPVEETSEQ